MGSCGANRGEMEDQSVIKGKFDQNEIRPSWSLIWGGSVMALREERKEERKKEKKKKKKKKKKRKGMDS